MKTSTRQQQDRRAGAAACERRVGRVPQFRVVDEFGVVATDIFLRHEIGRAERLGVIGVGRREKLADQRQRPRAAPPGLGAAGRVAPDHQRRAALAEVARVFRLFGDVPPARQAYTVGVQEPAKTLAVRPPAQIRARIDGALTGLAELFRYNPACDVGERHLVDGKRRLTRATPDSLVRIGKERGDHVSKSRTCICAIVSREFLRIFSLGVHTAHYTPAAAAVLHGITSFVTVQMA